MSADKPLISCIMPTRDRTDFALQAIRYFLRQDYPERELIIMDDSVKPLAERLLDDPRIRYARSPLGQTIGAKRNVGCELAQGEIVIQWDDDDWYGVDRIRLQSAPLRSGDADLTGLSTNLILDLPRWAFWRCAPELNQRLMGEIHGSTLAYSRRLWERGVHYPDISLGEDVVFLNRAFAAGARVKPVTNTEQFIYVRHGRNSWTFACGLHLNPEEWQRMSEPPLPPEDRAFYLTNSPVMPLSPTVPITFDQQLPSVTCLLFADREPHLNLLALHCFQNQTYPNRELLVVEEDSREIPREFVPTDLPIRFLHLDSNLTNGAKRNRACQEAHGYFIAHWDAMGWMDERRLHYQIENLLRQDADVCGLQKLLCYDSASDEAWEYVFPGGRRFLIVGETLCYTRAFWQRNPFPDTNDEAEAHFLWTDRLKIVLRLPDPTIYVALRSPSLPTAPESGKILRRPYSSKAVRSLLGSVASMVETSS